MRTATLRLGWLAAMAAGICAALWVAGGDRGDAALPGGNGLIAFQSNRNTDWDILVMQATPGAPATDLTSSTDGGKDDQAPSWTADGKRILFTSQRQAASSFSDDVHVMGSDGSLPTPLTESQASDFHATTSSSGSRIVFRSTLTGAEDIYVMNADGSGEQVVGSNPAIDTDPSLSPDGTKIAFMSRRLGTGDFNIHVMDLAGTELIPPVASVFFDGEPDWSPDGSKIAFVSSRNGGDLDIFTMNADGSGQTPLLDNATASESRPAWSPDGTRIAFNSNMDDAANNEIYVMNADGTGTPTRLTNSPGSDIAPAWQPLPSGTSPLPLGSPPPGPTPPSAPPITEVTRPAPKRQPGRVDARVRLVVRLIEKGFRILDLRVFEVTRGARVAITCGRGCSLRKATVVRGRSQSFRALFTGRRLPLSATIEIRVTKAGTIGRFFRYAVAGRGIRVTECRVGAKGKLTACTRG